MKRRFISRGYSWCNGLVTLDRNGCEFDTEADAKIIESIITQGVNSGGLVIEVPSKQSIRDSNVSLLAESLGVDIDQIKKSVAAATVIIAPVSTPDIQVEEQALKTEEDIRVEQIEKELHEKAVKKFDQEETSLRVTKKKPGRPPAQRKKNG